MELNVFPLKFIKHLPERRNQLIDFYRFVPKFHVHNSSYYLWNGFGVWSRILLFYLNGGQNPPSFVAHQRHLPRPQRVLNHTFVCSADFFFFLLQFEATCFECSPIPTWDSEMLQRAIYNSRRRRTCKRHAFCSPVVLRSWSFFGTPVITCTISLSFCYRLYRVIQCFFKAEQKTYYKNTISLLCHIFKVDKTKFSSYQQKQVGDPHLCPLSSVGMLKDVIELH